MDDDSDEDEIEVDPMCTRTVSSLLENESQTNTILQFMTTEAKNIYNTALFHSNLFMRYKNAIFEDMYKLVKKKEIKNIEEFDTAIQVAYDKYYEGYTTTVDKVSGEPIIPKKDRISANNTIIYKFMIEYIKKKSIIITNDNFYTIQANITKEIDRTRTLVIPKADKKDRADLYTDIVFNIMKSMYRHSFNNLKKKMLNRLPCDDYSEEFINQVRDNDMLVFDAPGKFKVMLMENPIFKPKPVPKNKDDNKDDKEKPKKQKKSTIKSDRNYMDRIIYRYYPQNKIPSDLKCNVIRKVHDNFSGYFASLAKGINAQRPSYLKSNDQFVLSFYSGSRRLETIDNIQYYKLTIGPHVAEHCTGFANNKNYICLNKKAKKLKYIAKRDLKPIAPGILRKDNFVIKNKYIERNSPKIIEPSFFYVQKPDAFEHDQLKLIEISPLQKAGRFKINFSYAKNMSDNVPIPGTMKSIDLGMRNLAAIYDPDPNGEQILIKGSQILNINNHFEKEIKKCERQLRKYNCKKIKKEKLKKKSGSNEVSPDNSTKGSLHEVYNPIKQWDKPWDPSEHQKFLDDFFDELKQIETKKLDPIKQWDKPWDPSEHQKFLDDFFDELKEVETNKRVDAKKQVDTKEKVNEFNFLTTSRRLRQLRLDREHAIDNYLNHLVSWIIKKYSDCETIIVGYNFGWKNKCNMGKKNNKKFYSIPYSKFLHKLKCRAEENNQRVCTTEESYTSKCDSIRKNMQP